MKNLDYKLDVMLRKTKIIISFANPENKTITQCTECWWLDNGHSNINSKERKMRCVNKNLQSHLASIYWKIMTNFQIHSELIYIYSKL